MIIFVAFTLLVAIVAKFITEVAKFVHDVSLGASEAVFAELCDIFNGYFVLLGELKQFVSDTVSYSTVAMAFGLFLTDTVSRRTLRAFVMTGASLCAAIVLPAFGTLIDDWEATVRMIVADLFVQVGHDGFFLFDFIEEHGN